MRRNRYTVLGGSKDNRFTGERRHLQKRDIRQLKIQTPVELRAVDGSGEFDAELRDKSTTPKIQRYVEIPCRKVSSDQTVLSFGRSRMPMISSISPQDLTRTEETFIVRSMPWIRLMLHQRVRPTHAKRILLNTRLQPLTQSKKSRLRYRLLWQIRAGRVRETDSGQ